MVDHFQSATYLIPGIISNSVASSSISMNSMGLPSFISGRSVLLTTILQAVFINTCANLIAQFIEAHKTSLSSAPFRFRVDVIRVLHFIIWTILSVPPNFRWQRFLERKFPAYHAEEKRAKSEADDEGTSFVVTRKRNFKHTLFKILCDQGCAAPINCFMFLTVLTLLKEHSILTALQTVHDKFWTLKFAGWKIWPAVGLVNFTFVPVDRRIIVATCVGLCWNIFLALFIS